MHLQGLLEMFVMANDTQRERQVVPLCQVQRQQSWHRRNVNWSEVYRWYVRWPNGGPGPARREQPVLLGTPGPSHAAPSAWSDTAHALATRGDHIACVGVTLARFVAEGQAHIEASNICQAMCMVFAFRYVLNYQYLKVDSSIVSITIVWQKCIKVDSEEKVPGRVKKLVSLIFDWSQVGFVILDITCHIYIILFFNTSVIRLRKMHDFHS